MGKDSSALTSEPVLGGRTAQIYPTEDQPRCVYNLVGDSFRKSIDRLQAEKPGLLGMTEYGLKDEFNSAGFRLSPADHRLRMKFWSAYDEAMHRNLPTIKMDYVCAGVCGREYFYRTYVNNNYKLAWLLCPPVNYEVYMEEALVYGLEQLREILELPNYASNGTPNTKVMELKAKIIFMLDQRVNGAIVQRIENKNMHLHAKVTPQQIESMTEPRTMEALDRTIKRLEEIERKALHLPPPAQPGAPTPEVLDADEEGT